MRVAGLALVLLAGCQQPKPLPMYGSVPDFELTTQSGSAFTKKDLDGKIWVADFIYTTCTGPCPLMSSKMRGVQASVPAVTLVSFSVDPERDTPQALLEYAKRYHAEPGRWFFLTGSHDTLQHLSRDAFKLSDASLTHSTRLVLVDTQSRIRGYYGTSDDGAMKDLLVDIRRLEKERT
jgi:protein SCO1/2